MWPSGVTFIPLSRINPRESTYPRAPEVIPMIDKLRYDAKFRPAIVQVFGKTLIAKDLTVASEYSQVFHSLAYGLSQQSVFPQPFLSFFFFGGVFHVCVHVRSHIT